MITCNDVLHVTQNLDPKPRCCTNCHEHYEFYSEGDPWGEDAIDEKTDQHQDFSVYCSLHEYALRVIKTPEYTAYIIYDPEIDTPCIKNISLSGQVN